MVGERREKESKRDYYFFKLFLKSEYRSPTKFYRYLEKNVPKKSLKYNLPKKETFRKISLRNDWVKRVKAYDDYNYLITNQEILKLDIQNNKQEYKDLHHIADKLRKNIILFLKNTDMSTIDSKDGFTLSQLVSSLKTIIELKRLVSEQSTTNIGLSAEIETKQEIKISNETIFDKVDQALGITENEN